jgi:hypothetical protein
VKILSNWFWRCVIHDLNRELNSGRGFNVHEESPTVRGFQTIHGQITIWSNKSGLKFAVRCLYTYLTQNHQDTNISA